MATDTFMLPVHTNKCLSLLLVDDHVILREGLRALLESQPDFHVVGEAGTFDEAAALH